MNTKIGNYYIAIATMKKPEPMAVLTLSAHETIDQLYMGKRYAGDVLMTIAVLLRSVMTLKCHVPFWRAVEEVTPLLTLILFLCKSARISFV